MTAATQAVRDAKAKLIEEWQTMTNPTQPQHLAPADLSAAAPAQLLGIAHRLLTWGQVNAKTRRKQERELARMEAELHRLQAENAELKSENDKARQLIAGFVAKFKGDTQP